MAPATSTSHRLVLRASLLGGALLDSTLAVAALAASLGHDLIAALSPAAVSYPWLLWPALAGRAGLQAFACYDRRRYEQALPWLALTLLATGLAAWRHAAAPLGFAALYGLIGGLQLTYWRLTR